MAEEKKVFEKQNIQETLTLEEKKNHLQEDLKELDQHRPNGLAVLPLSVDFETKDREEQVILLLRRHFFTNVRWMVISLALGIFLPLLALVIFPEDLPQVYKLLIVMIIELVIVGYAIENFLKWYFNIFIVTDERVVDIDFHNLLNREISDADLDKIQDITIRGLGVGAAVFNYGDIFIQTAAEKQFFELRSVPQPEKVSKVMRDLVEYNELKEQKELHRFIKHA